MIKSYIFLVIISIIISAVLSTSDDTCHTKSNTDCDTCLNISGCSFCKNTKECFASRATAFQAPCSTSDLLTVTCSMNFLTLLIILCSVGAAVLLIILIGVCCLRKKCRQCTNRKLQRRQRVDEQQMEDRRAAAEARSAERNEKADQVRMKYGLFKEKDSSGDYKRMS